MAASPAAPRQRPRANQRKHASSRRHLDAPVGHVQVRGDGVSDRAQRFRYRYLFVTSARRHGFQDSMRAAPDRCFGCAGDASYDRCVLRSRSRRRPGRGPALPRVLELRILHPESRRGRRPVPRRGNAVSSPLRENCSQAAWQPWCRCYAAHARRMAPAKRRPEREAQLQRLGLA